MQSCSGLLVLLAQAQQLLSAVFACTTIGRRLVAHMQSTPGFTLQHLRYLVVDEADRLLRQAYQVRVGKTKRGAGPSTGAAAVW